MAASFKPNCRAVLLSLTELKERLRLAAKMTIEQRSSHFGAGHQVKISKIENARVSVTAVSVERRPPLAPMLRHRRMPDARPCSLWPRHSRDRRLVGHNTAEAVPRVVPYLSSPGARSSPAISTYHNAKRVGSCSRPMLSCHPRCPGSALIMRGRNEISKQVAVALARQHR